ncbi:YadA-like family protein, partial [Psychrobacter glacincola]
KGYTDDKATETLTASKGYTDGKATETLALSQSYTNDQVLSVKQDIAAQHKYLSINGGTSAEAIASGDNAMALGTNAAAQGKQSIAMGDGAQAIGEQAISIGTGNKVTGNHSGAIGDPSTVSGNNSYSMGNNNTVSGDNTFVLGNNINTTAKNAVVLGNDSSSSRENTVSVGSDINQRQIINVANGTANNDAVNVSQLQDAKTSAIETSNTYTDTKFNALNDSIHNYLQDNGQRFKEIDDRFDRQGAMSAAMLNMATSTSGLQGKNRIGVGAGFQGSEQAVSLGYQRVINPNTSFSLGGAFTKDENSGGMGMGFSW